MDLSLPVMDGWEATRRLKADERTRHIPVVALTGHALAGHLGGREEGRLRRVRHQAVPAGDLVARDSEASPRRTRRGRRRIRRRSGNARSKRLLDVPAERGTRLLWRSRPGSRSRAGAKATRRRATEAPTPPLARAAQQERPPGASSERGAAWPRRAGDDALGAGASTSTASSASDEPLRFGPLGLGAEPADVHTVNYKDIAAVVSDTPIEVHDPTRENVLAHERVNETVMQRAHRDPDVVRHRLQDRRGHHRAAALGLRGVQRRA